MHSNSAEVTAAAAALLASTGLTGNSDHLPKVSPAAGGGAGRNISGTANTVTSPADPASATASGGGSGEQPLDLSAKPSGGGCAHSGMFIDPKQAFR